ncbi:MAG: helix-hairpin-helix domain-containing protein [Sandaracinaceae bacterium]
MSRRAVVDVLERLAFAAELTDDPRGRTWAAAAWAIRNLKGDLEEMRANGELARVRGVGESTLRVIDDALAGQKPEALARAEAQLPPGLFAVRRIKGLGPKKVKRLWKELGIGSLGELEYACRENRLVDLSGFGAKTQANVLAQIAKVQAGLGKMRRDQAQRVLEPIVSALEASGLEATIVEDYARGLELVERLAVLVAVDDEARADAAREVVQRAKPAERDVLVHLASPEQRAARAVWLTSSPSHAAALASRAHELGLRFEEEGLFDETGAAIACADDDAVYRALELSTTPPERRDDDVPLVLVGHAAPTLVRREDLRGALHNHTEASDGSATLTEMRDAARRRGLDYLGVSEHSHTAFYARGLDAERLSEQRALIDALNREADGCVLLTGVESDILEHGELDYPDEVLEDLEVVVASVHKRFKHTREEHTARMIAAARNPYTDVIGHPTGRLLLAREATDVDMEALLQACRESGCAMELNANPHRLDLSVEHLRMAKALGVLVSISADAHATRELDHLEHGIAVARRAGLAPEDVLNTRTADELRGWVRERRAR